MSADGNIVVGALPVLETGGFIWNAGGGSRDLLQVFRNAGASLGPTATLGATGISADGRRIAGSAGYRESNTDKLRVFAWIADNNMLGDVNVDWVTDIFDVNLVSEHWGESGPVGDANGDGVVDIFDVNQISEDWTHASAETIAVPEPTAAALLVAGALSLCSSARRQRRFSTGNAKDSPSSSQ